MFKSIKEFFFGKETPAPKVEDTKVEAVNAAPYKVEAPATTPIPLVAETKPAKKAPAKKAAAPKAKAPAKKSLAKAGDKKQPGKKPPAKKTK
jgi:hypothetical protein